MSAQVAQIKEAARRLGFEVVGIAAVAPLCDDEAAFFNWCDAGFAADMQYMMRRRELHANPQQLVPAALSIITLAVNYYVAAPEFAHENRYGRVARYAWGLDYHDVVKARLHKLIAEIERLEGSSIAARAFVDAVPLLERAIAARVGLGFIGKNTNLLQPRRGSWFFLAEILLNLELPVEEQRVTVSCGSCHRCLDACPTDAFAAAYQLDSRRCISYLTIENKGEIPRDLRASMGEWLFGCDVCQEVCPFNRFAADTHWQEFRPEYGAGQKLDVVDILSIKTDEEFRARFKGTPLTRPKRRGLLRNAAVAAANIECTAAVPVLLERIAHDPEPLIRSHALWALSRLDRQKARQPIGSCLSDPDPRVREEAARLQILSNG